MTKQRMIRLEGVRVHNLRGIDVSIPLGRMTVVTGVSGSGKSSLAFDTLYAEGRRRYVECLSTYAQQYLDRMARPDLDRVGGLPPAVAIQRAVPAAQARSTVGSTTEIHDCLRLLFARLGETFCVECGSAVREDAPGDVARRVIAAGGEGMLTFELDPPGNRKRWVATIGEIERDGFVRLWQGGRAVHLDEAVYRRGPVEIVVDRLTFERSRRARIAEAVETAYRFGGGRCAVRSDAIEPQRFSCRLHCADCDRDYRRPEPRMFSPNSPLGACEGCQGFGRSIGLDLERIIPDDTLTLAQGPVDPWNKPSHRRVYRDLRRAGEAVGLRWDVPYRQLPAEQRRMIERGAEGFYGISGFFKRLERKKYKLHVRVFLARYRAYRPCDDCGGSKLRPEALAVRVAGEQIAELASWPVERLLAWIGALRPAAGRRKIASPILRELARRLEFLVEVGLGYLSLERPSRTLSGGEAQRIHLARSIGSALVDTLYVLDEPSVGLHPQDVERLVRVLRRLRDLGNTVVVVEHDPRVIREADWLIDLGPGAGAEGGRLLYEGDPAGLRFTRESVTAAFLRTRDARPSGRNGAARKGVDWIELSGARTHNLKNVSVRIPRRSLCVVTGVSGSGKSSLIHDTLYGALSRALGGPPRDCGEYRELRGIEGLSAVELIDQSPIGKSSRSNPVTYVKAFDGIRKRFAATPPARSRGLKPGYFSFNVAGGRCEDCEGAGSRLVEMYFLPDLLVTCEACGGSRFGPGALEIRDRGRNVAEVLRLTVRQALELYASDREIVKRLGVLDEIGLGYLQLGQPAPTLSGGEAQRLKLAAHLMHRGGEESVFLLDEPTTGLHLSDVAVLLGLLNRLVDAGHTVLVVEHHLELVRAADWVIDLGPGAGEQGGQVVAAGPPAEVARSKGRTGRYLSQRLRLGPG